MFCLQCGIENSPDSKFCKECGSAVSEKKRAKVVATGKLSPHIAEDLGASIPENPQINRLLDMAFWHNQTGNVPPAILACEAALMIDPESTTALSLLGCLYEKQGDVRKAIDAFERVMELNPESVADQEKLAALKRGEYIRPLLQPIKYRWLPPALVVLLRRSTGARIAVAVIAAASVFAVGMLIFAPRKGGSNTVSGPLPATAPAPTLVAANPTPPTAAPSQASPNPAVSSFGQQPADGAAAAAPTQPTSIANSSAPNFAPTYTAQPSTTTSPGFAAQTAPAQGQSAVPAIATVASADPNAPSVDSVTPISPTPSELVKAVQIEQGSQMPQHTVVVGPDGSTTYADQDPSDDNQASEPNQAAAPPPPPEHISIHVVGQSNGQAVNVLPTDPSESLVSSSSSSTAARGPDLQNKAIDMQQQGQYQSAAHYYNQAIDAYKQEIAAGGPSDIAQRGIIACQTGLQICQQSQ